MIDFCHVNLNRMNLKEGCILHPVVEQQVVCTFEKVLNLLRKKVILTCWVFEDILYPIKCKVALFTSQPVRQEHVL